MNPFVIHERIFNKNTNCELIFLLPDQKVHVHERFCNCEAIEKRVAIYELFWTRLACKSDVEASS